MVGRRIPELSGIRGLAIFLVICWHFCVAPVEEVSPTSWPGRLLQLGSLTWSGVDLFFVLSGFLIGGILVDAKGARAYFGSFYLRRSFRILPLYLVLCVGGTLVVAWSPLLDTVLGAAMPIGAIALFVQNFWQVHHRWNHFMAVTWSLAIEEQFYLALPLIVRVVPRRRLPHAILFLAVASVVGRAWFCRHQSLDWNVAVFLLTPFRADALMVGVLGALIVRSERLRDFLASRSWPLGLAVSVFGAGTGFMAWKRWSIGSLPMSTFGYSVLALFYLSLLLLAVLRTDGWWARFMRFRPLIGLGEIAYGVYLIHGTMFDGVSFLLRGYPRRSWPDWPAAAIAFVLSIVVARFSWRVFESRMIRLGQRAAIAIGYGPRRVPAPVPSTTPARTEAGA